jgi:hypothetical protein
MLRIIQNRSLFRFAILASVAAVVVAPSILIPYYLGRDAEPLSTSLVAPEDADAAIAFRDGYRHERAGNLEDALAKYREAATAETVTIQEAATRGVDRVHNKLVQLQTFYYDLKDLNGLSLSIRAPLIALLLLALVIFFLSQLWPRRGIALRPFTLTPQIESNATEGFNRSLSQEINRIVRVYSSDQFTRTGVKIAMPDLVSDNEQGDIWARALSSLREGGLKTLGGFSAGELLRFMRNVGNRPEYILTGSVTLTTMGASAEAELTQVKDGKSIAIWEASSLEAEVIATARIEEVDLSKQPTTNHIIVYTVASGDARQNAKFLADLAVILASKIWYRLAQGAPVEMRPSSWQTIFHFVRALSALEQAE